jgi:hypothetical protein
MKPNKILEEYSHTRDRYNNLLLFKFYKKISKDNMCYFDAVNFSENPTNSLLTNLFCFFFFFFFFNKEDVIHIIGCFSQKSLAIAKNAPLKLQIGNKINRNGMETRYKGANTYGGLGGESGGKKCRANPRSIKLLLFNPRAFAHQRHIYTAAFSNTFPPTFPHGHMDTDTNTRHLSLGVRRNKRSYR